VLELNAAGACLQPLGARFQVLEKCTCMLRFACMPVAVAVASTIAPLRIAEQVLLLAFLKLNWTAAEAAA
jgi:hypothetical protein